MLWRVASACKTNLMIILVYRLLDFTSLNAKKKPSDVYYEPKKKKEPIKSKKEEKLTEMMADSAHNLNETADSNSEVSRTKCLLLRSSAVTINFVWFFF